MSKNIQALRGMPDLLPEDAPLWQAFEAAYRDLMRSYGYQEIRFPILESTALFKRSIGEVTDIVEKEMFSFADRDGESISLRPEGTAGCVRAGLEHGLLYNQIQRLWLSGPMFRYEKPQKGRFRQFHQVGAEAFGLPGPDIEVEHILMMARFFRELKVDTAVRLEINTLGSETSRKHYRSKLVEYFSKYHQDLDEDSQRRLHTNPLRILDSKNPNIQDLIRSAPKGEEFLEKEDQQHFENFQAGLKEAGVAFSVNPRIVRGLDYYNRTVYEWITDKLGAQPAVCAGGRYDGLVAALGGKSTPGVGFAVGVERVILLQQALGYTQLQSSPLYFIHVGGEVIQRQALGLAEKIRDACPHLGLVFNCGGGDFKTQFKRADKAGAKIALVLGEDESQQQSLTLKFLREERPQVLLKFDQVVIFLKDYFSSEF